MPTFSLWRGNVRNKRGGERMARWRFFGVSKKCLKKTLLVLPRRTDCFCASFVFFTRVSCSPLCLLFYTAPADVWKKCIYDESQYLLSLSHTDPKRRRKLFSQQRYLTLHEKIFSQKSPEISNVHVKSFLAFQRERLGALLNNNDSFFIVSVFLIRSFHRARACV